MNEIDAGLRAFAFVAFLSGVVGPIIWLVIRRGFVVIAVGVLSIQIVMASASANWAKRSGLELGYQGLPPTFKNLLIYYTNSFGTVFVGLSLICFILMRSNRNNIKK